MPKQVGVIFTALSALFAIALLCMLLTVATSSAPDRFRVIGLQLGYLDEVLASLARGTTEARNRESSLDEELAALEVALTQGTDALQTSMAQSYLLESSLDQWRTRFAGWLNVLEQRPGEYTAADAMDLQEDVLESLRKLSSQVRAFAKSQKELVFALQGFDTRAQALTAELRQRGLGNVADQVYVNSEQIRTMTRGAAEESLDQGVLAISRLERAETDLDGDDRAALRVLINEAYALMSVQRGLNQSIGLIEQSNAAARLSALQQRLGEDQYFVVSAVNDARVLLNVYTVLLLVVAGFFGLRLRASHVALNRSHDDLEQRVAARTSDLAQANDNLKESQVQLVQAEKMSSLGQLVAGVMHEINTPLLYVLNNTTLTADSIGELAPYLRASMPILQARSNDEARQAIRNFLAKRGEFDLDELTESLQEVESLSADSVDGLNQISELVQSLKDFSRLDRVADDLFDVRDGIEKTLTITRNLLKQGVEVVRDLQPVPEIYCSPSRLNQVFINIVTNAVQAMDGKGTLRVATSFSEARKLTNPAFIIGGTANTIDDIEMHSKAGANYVGVGPFRFTTTKKKLSPVLGLEGYKIIVDECNKRNIFIPLIAIGGIELNDIPAIMQTGVFGIAVSGLIANSDNTEETVKQIFGSINSQIITAC
jgi:signal transduction histidine kinase